MIQALITNQPVDSMSPILTPDHRVQSQIVQVPINLIN